MTSTSGFKIDFVKIMKSLNSREKWREEPVDSSLGFQRWQVLVGLVFIFVLLPQIF